MLAKGMLRTLVVEYATGATGRHHAGLVRPIYEGHKVK